MNGVGWVRGALSPAPAGALPRGCRDGGEAPESSDHTVVGVPRRRSWEGPRPAKPLRRRKRSELGLKWKEGPARQAVPWKRGSSEPKGQRPARKVAPYPALSPNLEGIYQKRRPPGLTALRPPQDPAAWPEGSRPQVRGWGCALRQESSQSWDLNNSLEGSAGCPGNREQMHSCEAQEWGGGAGFCRAQGGGTEGAGGAVASREGAREATGRPGSLPLSSTAPLPRTHEKTCASEVKQLEGEECKMELLFQRNRLTDTTLSS